MDVVKSAVVADAVENTVEGTVRDVVVASVMGVLEDMAVGVVVNAAVREVVAFVMGVLEGVDAVEDVLAGADGDGRVDVVDAFAVVAFVALIAFSYC